MEWRLTSWPPNYFSLDEDVPESTLRCWYNRNEWRVTEFSELSYTYWNSCRLPTLLFSHLWSLITSILAAWFSSHCIWNRKRWRCAAGVEPVMFSCLNHFDAVDRQNIIKCQSAESILPLFFYLNVLRSGHANRALKAASKCHIINLRTSEIVPHASDLKIPRSRV